MYQVIKQLFIQALVYCRFVLVAPILLFCKEMFLFSLVHYCLANPFVVCIEICFEQQNNTELSTLKSPADFSILTLMPFFQWSYEKPVQSGMLAIVALIIRISGLMVLAI